MGTGTQVDPGQDTRTGPATATEPGTGVGTDTAADPGTVTGPDVVVEPAPNRVDFVGQPTG